MRELVSEFYELGVRTIKMEPVYITKNSRGNQKLSVSPSEFVSNFLDAVKYIRENNLDMQIDTAFFSRPTLGNYCSLSTGNIILTPSGDISGCIEITNKCDYHSEDVFYGRFEERLGEIIFDKSKKESFRKFHFTNYNNCPSCNLKLICKGGCPLRRIWNQEEHFCKITKKLIPQLLKLFYKDPSYAKIFIKK
ncbi:MAG: SPASM domain-containing protein [Candidatus Pacearchaeota archaeon]